jgi:hypothetical protein
MASYVAAKVNPWLRSTGLLGFSPRRTEQYIASHDDAYLDVFSSSQIDNNRRCRLCGKRNDLRTVIAS